MVLAGFVGVFEEEGVLEVVGWRAWVWVEFVVDVDVQVVGEEETKKVDEKTWKPRVYKWRVERKR